MKAVAPRLARWWAGPGPSGPPGHLVSRWLFLRALGVIYFSAFYSLVFQIRGLLGPDGLLPAGSYLQEVAKVMPGATHLWYAPTLLWLNSSGHALAALCWVGMLASLLLVFNVWPRAMLVICFIFFLSFVAAAEEFSGYQSDGMLLAAGFAAFFLAPRGFRPRWGHAQPPSRASLFLLRLLWFEIYFESGVAKFFGGDRSWRDLSAMNEYYQNGPLPTWIGWYASQLPRRVHEATALITLAAELLLVWALWLPRRARIVCFFLVTALQIGIILTANYAFLNYLVLALGVFLLDDRFLVQFLPRRSCQIVRRSLAEPPEPRWWCTFVDCFRRSSQTAPSGEPVLFQPAPRETAPPALLQESDSEPPDWKKFLTAAGLAVKTFFLVWVAYATCFLLLHQVWPQLPLSSSPVQFLDPFRVANSYGLFGRMTWARYEIEFQGSNDGVHWIAYPFRYKPQALNEAPGIYAPYQPRFEWNLWFASLGAWRENPFVVRTEQQLLLNNKNILALFRFNPFANAPPTQVRSVVWQYWFTDRAAKKSTGDWWRREYRGLYAPTLQRTSDGTIAVSEWPQGFLPPP